MKNFSSTDCLKTDSSAAESLAGTKIKLSLFWKVAKFLSKQKKVVKVCYPYKKNTPRYKLWKKYYSGASGLMGLRIKSKNKNSIKKFVNSLKLFGYGYSWGGFESLALHQSVSERGNRAYLDLDKNERMVRLHIGLEDPNDLIKDLKNSLKFVK